MTTPHRKLSGMISALLAFSSAAASRSDQKVASTVYRLERTSRQKGARRKQRRKLEDAALIYSYDGLYDAEDWQYHLADANRKHTGRSCVGKGKDSDSCAPTTFPSVSPSAFPTTSTAPSAVPSVAPSALPSQSPSNRPSASPSISLNPSTQPSEDPSSLPTASPSEFPTKFPSHAPSQVPSLSLMSTPELYETTEQGESGLVTTCIVQPTSTDASSGVLQEQTLAFQYNLYTIPDAVLSDEVAIMEASLHDALSRNFLTCTYNNGGQSSFYVTAINAAPDDSLSDTACDTSNDPTPPVDSLCAVVNAEFTMTVFFPTNNGVRRGLQTTGTTNASPEVLTPTGDFLDTAMTNGDFTTDEIVQVSFQGFVDIQGGGTPPASGGDGGGGGNGIAAIAGNGNPPSNVTDNRVAIGGAVVGLAAMILLLFLFVSNRRRKQRHEAYLDHLETISVSDLTYNNDNNGKKSREVLGDGKVHLVLDESSNYDVVNSSEEGSNLGFILRDLNVDSSATSSHDVHNCTSATCEVCRRDQEQNPTFISAPPQGYTFSEWQRSISEIRDSYRSPDTVQL